MLPPVHQVVFHNSPFPGLILERRAPGEFYILDVNSAARKSGAWRTVREQDVIGRDIADVFPRIRETRLLDMYEHALDSQEEIDLGEFESEGPEAPRGILSLHLVPIDERKLLVAFEDVTDRVQAERQLEVRIRELERSNAQLEGANQELEEFSDSLAHDLKNPLLNTVQFSDSLYESLGGSLDEQQRDYLQRIRSSCRRMTHIVDDLRDLAKVNSVEISQEEVNLSSLGREIIDELSMLVPDRDVSFEVESGVMAVGDESLLRLLLTNLLQNAWKYTGPRDDARIELGVDEDETDVPTYYVRDNGIGFDNADVEWIFRAFKRLHTRAEFAGSGLGLATVARIVRRHRGRVWAEGTLGEGAVFRFTLGPASTDN